MQESLPTRAAPRRAGSAIPSLTGIRGVAALYVCLTHAQIVLATYLNAPAINQKRLHVTTDSAAWTCSSCCPASS